MRFVFLFIFFSFCTSACTGSSASYSDVYRSISENEQLVGLTEICPSDLVPEKDIHFENHTSDCGQNQNSCLKKCLRGSSNHCFGLANHLNIVDDRPSLYSQSLYAKSCQLGLVSACTNVGAGLKNEFGLKQANCYTETFEKTCELDDPWGCTMYAISLIYGEGTEKDLNKALSVMRGSCRFGESDRACSTALELTSEITMGEFEDK
ncbi:MAG: sel1 repeat family protein [Litorimonas sp.]